jgi:hypothetical protein
MNEHLNYYIIHIQKFLDLFQVDIVVFKSNNVIKNTIFKCKNLT